MITREFLLFDMIASKLSMLLRVFLLFLFCPDFVQVVSSSPSPVLKNLARGSALKCLADLCGGLPFEVWKSNVVVENIRANHEDRDAKNDIAVLRRVLNERGVQGLWSGWQVRMVEGFFSGAVLLATKETIRKTLTASPVISKNIPPYLIGFIAGAFGGASQAVVMAPCSLLVTATANNGGTVVTTAKSIWAREGLRGIYRGGPAISYRQATNWASRQGFAELIRPRVQISGMPGEIVAGLLSGILSTWNTPFDVARITSQSKVFSDHHNADSQHYTLLETMRDVVKKRGVKGLYTGIFPRIGQSCYQTIFLVSIP
eukprot:CAMPEP_0194228176 /NCGR_PEP_ID=MMETSP0156-20130528/43238_1 /TAXON_ID=33649 /ORGANISM="Thalassionema nitzschioides, Strain L26-B" /LENGTH=315 /DNA_ID=CAMNT_0038960683 /DNA_START=2366 /DNA_END=3310 /DNA_ORIENTATION=-